MFFDQFANILVGLLVGASILAAAIGEPMDAAAIAAIVVLNAVIGFVQERRAAGALAALRTMTAPTARVRRDGRVCVVPAADLVPGDMVVLEAGDLVPADLRALSSMGLRTQEAALTGESEPVEKEARATVAESAALAERRTMIYLGTSVAGGTGEAVVVSTGSQTELGHIVELVGAAAREEPETPLQVRLRIFGRWLVAVTGGVVALVLVLGLLRGIEPVEMLMTSVSLGVAAVPEGLPAVVTIALALGVRRMARRRALIRKLASVETLGCTTVICSDKTGTLTVGQMTVRTLATIDDRIDFEGEGYRPAGRILREGVPVKLEAGEPAARALWAAAACCTARLMERGEEFDVAGDPTEGALIVAGIKAGIEPEAIEAREAAVGGMPFDSDRKRMSVVRRGAGGERAYVKGALESVLPLCREVLSRAGARPLDPDDRIAIESRHDAMAARGIRVLATAFRELPPGGDPEGALVFLGLVGMHDPPRPEARAAVESCRAAGIRPVMITGDNPRTALAVARAVGIAEAESEAVTGPDLAAWGEEALEARVESISVYARVSPEHKLRIVRAWKRRGAVVAMTGDGVNDAPALTGADIGVAMGRTGTDVARDASAMVITDDNFATIVSAVEEGRVVFENIRKTLLYLLSGNIAEILIMTVAVVAGWPLPLVAIQLLWVNLVTDGLPALALVTDPADRDLLHVRPRRPGQEIVDRDFLLWMLASALLNTACTLGAFLWGLEALGSAERARTYAFSTLAIGEILCAFAFRSRTRILWELGAFSNARLAFVGAATVAIQIACHWIEPMGAFLKTGPLTLEETVGVMTLSLVPVTVLELWKLLRRWVQRTVSPAR